MKTIAALLILLFASTAFAGPVPKPTEEYCEKVRKHVTFENELGHTLYKIGRLILLKDFELLCFNEKVREEARSQENIRWITSQCTNFPIFCRDLKPYSPSLDN